MDFKNKIISNLETKGLSESSIKLYIKNLERLNNGFIIKDLKFLNNVDDIIKFLEKYKDTTKRGYLISICSVLETMKDDSKKNNELYQKYFNQMVNINNIIKAVPTETMTATQKDNWIDWADVIKKYDELYNIVSTFINNKEINKKQYDLLLELVVLGLYRWLPPRRNEYTNMYIIKKYKSDMDNSINYLSLDDKKFIFNQYKTSKVRGQEIEDVPNELMELLKSYFKFHPLIKNKEDRPLLVYFDGSSFNNINSITRILNKIFGMKVSSSMLRHSWISSEFGDTYKKMKENADKMGHSLTQSLAYIKDDTQVQKKPNNIQVAFN